MKPPLLIALSVAALAVGGYALVTVWDAQDRSPSTEDASKTAKRSRTRDSVDERPPRSVPAPGGDRGLAFERADAEADDGDPVEPAPRGPPPPELSLEEARSNFADVMTDIDRAIEDGEPLSQRQWVDLYRRGAEALDPLLRHLDPADPEMGEELTRYQAQLRDKLRQLEPGQTTRLPAPE